MAKVGIVPSLEIEINKHFKHQSVEIFEFLKTLEDNPKKGKSLGHVGGIAIKELKYKGYRFYFITDAHAIRVFDVKELQDLLLQFVRMSNKKNQQQTIDEIRTVLTNIGTDGFA